jgi:hypothetical protein
MTMIVQAAVVASLFIYVLVFEVLRSRVQTLPRPVGGINPQVLRYVFYGLGILAVILTRILNRVLLKDRPGELLPVFLHMLSRAAVITSVLSVAPAVLGFVLALLTGGSRDFYYLSFVSLFLVFIYFPRRRVWEELLREKFPQDEI